MTDGWNRVLGMLRIFLEGYFKRFSVQTRFARWSSRHIRGAAIISKQGSPHKWQYVGPKDLYWIHYAARGMCTMEIVSTSDPNDTSWLTLRAEFIPEVEFEEQRRFLQAFAGNTAAFRAFVARDAESGLLGFAEVAVRTDFVNGCEHRPALFLEGIFVRPEHRGRGVARALCKAAAAWGLEQGCREFASDVYVDDHDSLAAHRGLGFEETERVVYFRKSLAAS